jgi:uncharacterized protein YdeI (BOF family)
MLRRSSAVLLVLIVAVVALAAFAPATLMDRGIAAATEGRLRISDADGTLWHGRGDVADARGAWRIPVGWAVAPTALLRGAMGVEFEPLADGGGPRGNVTLQERAIELRDVSLTIPAVAAARTLTDASPVELAGNIVVAAPAFRYVMSGGDGALDVRWERARLAWNDAMLDLGMVTAHLVPRGRELAGAITNAGGMARVDGDIALGPDIASLRLTIVPGPSVPPPIASAIAALGVPEPSGGVRLQWRIGGR